MLGKEIPELMKMLVKEKREESLDLKGMSSNKTAKDSFVSITHKFSKKYLFKGTESVWSRCRSWCYGRHW